MKFEHKIIHFQQEKTVIQTKKNYLLVFVY